jgi:hypothetical protein
MPTPDHQHGIGQLRFALTWKQAVRILSIAAVIIAGYYKMLGDIKEAARLPEPEVTREEYNLKFEATATHIQYLRETDARFEAELQRLRDKVESE